MQSIGFILRGLFTDLINLLFSKVRGKHESGKWHVNFIAVVLIIIKARSAVLRR